MKALRNIDNVQNSEQSSKTACYSIQSLPGNQDAAPERIGFDKIDSLPFSSLPEPVNRAASMTLFEATTALCGSDEERKKGINRLLARTIQQYRVQLRYFEALRNRTLDAYVEGKASFRRMETMERIVQRQHKRLFDALHHLENLHTAPASPKIRIHAGQAAVLVKEGP